MKPFIPVLLAFGLLLSACQLNLSSVGTWSVVAAPPVPISTSSVVPLADGRVAFLGGVVQETGLPSPQVLIFDPVRNTWVQGAPMPEAIGFGAVVTRLQDGTVLVAGGSGGPNGLVTDTWTYDPARNSWTRAGSMRILSDQPSFTVLTDGRVLVAGGLVPLDQPIQLSNGQTINEKPIAAAELFDPRTRTWSPAGQLSAARGFVTLISMPNGAALAAGGCSGLGFLAGAVFQQGTGEAFRAADVFDPQKLTWTPTTPMPATRCGATGVSLLDGRAFIAGGDQGAVPSAVIFDLARRSWTPVGAATGTPVVLADGRVLIPGYQVGPQRGRVGTEFVGGQIFDPASGAWSVTTTTAVPVSAFLLIQGLNPVAVALPNGDAFVLLETVAITFHPNVAPPPAQVLESSGLTLLLLGVAAILGLLLLVGYLLGRRRGRDLITA
jgi:hypothetical protein